MSSSKRAGDPGSTPAAAPGAAKASTYHRFIPKEEVHTVHAWNPGVFAEDGSRPAPPVGRAAAPAPAPAPAPEDPATILRTARQAGYQNGYRDGLAALEAFKQSHSRQMSSQIGGLVASFDSQFDALEAQMAQALASAATELARQVVRQELATHPALIVAVAREALASLMLAARHVTVKVHPDDLPLVAAGATEELERRGARLLASAAVTRGGCVVESDLGLVDASLATRWQRAAAGLAADGIVPDLEPADLDAGPGAPLDADAGLDPEA